MAVKAQVDAPEVLKLPAGHFWHVVEPVAKEKLPEEQRVQLDAPAPEKVPGGQSVQLVAFATENVPGAQRGHANSSGTLSSKKVPAVHMPAKVNEDTVSCHTEAPELPVNPK